jgi:hypothetical protein
MHYATRRPRGNSIWTAFVGRGAVNEIGQAYEQKAADRRHYSGFRPANGDKAARAAQAAQAAA